MTTFVWELGTEEVERGRSSTLTQIKCARQVLSLSFVYRASVPMSLKRTISVVLPAGATTLKKTRRSTSKSKAKRLYNWKTVVKGRDPFGSNFTTTLNYADSYAISPATVPVHVLRMNSIYDPDYTTTGHQPMGRDQLAELYNRYRVLGFSYEVWGSETSNPPLPCFLIVCPTNGLRTFASGLDMLEHPNAKVVNLATTGDPGNTLKGYIDLAAFTGKTRAAYKADDQYQALMGNNPGELMMLNISVVGMSGAFAQAAVFVKLKYHVECYDAVPLQQS